MYPSREQWLQSVRIYVRSLMRAERKTLFDRVCFVVNSHNLGPQILQQRRVPKGSSFVLILLVSSTSHTTFRLLHWPYLSFTFSMKLYSLVLGLAGLSPSVLGQSDLEPRDLPECPGEPINEIVATTGMCQRCRLDLFDASRPLLPHSALNSAPSPAGIMTTVLYIEDL